MTHSEEIMVANMDTKEREFVNNLMCENSRLEERITELETITDEKVDRVARAMFEIDMAKGSWDNEPSERLKNRVRNQVRVGLKAAIGGDDE